MSTTTNQFSYDKATFAISNSGVISDCYSFGYVYSYFKTNYQSTPTDGKGFCYSNSNTINNCYYVGSVTSREPGFCKDYGTINSCFYDKTIGGFTDGTMGKSTTAMRLKETYTGWDFDNVWTIDPDINGGYPVLRVCKNPVGEVFVKGVSLDKTSSTILRGGTVTLTPTITPDYATNKKVTWSSSDGTIAAVDSNGKVTGIGYGTATITATTADGGHKATCTVTVAASTTVAVTGVTLNKTSLSLNTGDTATLTATVLPSNASNKGVMWTSSKSAVATVSNGVVTAVAPGTATITVKTLDGSYTATCSVTVTEKTSDSGYTNIDDYLMYTVTSDEATITGVTGTISGDVTFSSTIDGYPVTTIGASAFYECSDITSFKVPEGITLIDESAFSDCYSLESIELPDSLEKFGAYSFSYCDSLKSICMPLNLETISTNAFVGCIALEEITVAEDHSWLQSVDGALISNGKSLVVYPAGRTQTSYSVPSYVTKIFSSAFDSCVNLKTISIPDSVTEMLCSFNGCSNLETISVNSSNTVYASDDGVLFDKAKTTLLSCPVNKKGTSYTIPSGVNTIGSMAFYYNRNIEEIIISDEVTTIEYFAFSFCDSLESIVMPKSITAIEAYAFYSFLGEEPLSNIYYKGSRDDWATITIGENNTLLDSVTIHYNYGAEEKPTPAPTAAPTPEPDTEGLIDYGTDANGIDWYFYESGLLKIVGSGAMEDYSKTSAIPWYDERANISEVEINDGITRIGNRSFYNCISLQKVSIPTSVTEIGTYAFRNCEEMTIYAEAGSYAETYAKENSISFVNTKKEELKEIFIDDPYESNTKWFFDVSVDGYTQEATVYVAAYDSNDKIISISYEEFIPEDITTVSLTKNSNISYVKIYVWTDSMSPITEVGCVEL